MMTRMFCFLMVTALMLAPSRLLAAADQPASEGGESSVTDQATTQSPAAISEPAAAEPAAPVEMPPEPEVAESFEEFVGQYPDEQYLTISDAQYQPWLATRFGWWGLSTSGSPYGVGEWQGLKESSPFFDVDGITSNGNQTLDFFVTGPESEATQGGLYFYGGPRFSADVDYDRFIHRLGHEPLGGPREPNLSGVFPPQGGFYDPALPNNQPGYVLWGQDYNKGDDYALRVQTFDSKFKGRITDDISWRLNVWGMKKEGIRQANSQQHCLSASANGVPGAGNTCHVVSKGQRVDWMTVDIEPVIAARLTDWLTVEYSHTVRSFEQNDEIVTGNFSRGSPYGWGPSGANGAYAYVPENITDIDRLKLLGQLGPNTDLYVMGHVGNTHNEFRESDRKFYGVDARVTNTSIDGLALTAYGKTFTQNNSADTVSLNNRYPTQTSLWLEQAANNPAVALSPQEFYASPPVSEPWYLGLADRDWLTMGAKGRWRPFHDSCDVRRGLSFTGGYEWSEIRRTSVTYYLENLSPPEEFTQPTTVTNTYFVGLAQEWSPRLDTYVRYRMIANSWPIVGITQREQLNVDAAANSNQPEHEDRIEIGGNWHPMDNLLLSASFWIQNSYNRSELVNFDEDSYPIILSGWYAPDDRWSFTGGYATFSNWIVQDVTLGREDGADPLEYQAFTSPWRYAGRADVLNGGASFAATCRTTLIGGVEYVRSRNVITDVPSSPQALAAGNPYTDMPSYSQVRVNTWRLTAGLDYELSQYMNTFFRYNYFDYNDQAMPYNAGQAHMLMGGLSGVF